MTTLTVSPQFVEQAVRKMTASEKKAVLDAARDVSKGSEIIGAQDVARATMVQLHRLAPQLFA